MAGGTGVSPEQISFFFSRLVQAGRREGVPGDASPMAGGVGVSPRTNLFFLFAARRRRAARSPRRVMNIVAFGRALYNLKDRGMDISSCLHYETHPKDKDDMLETLPLVLFIVMAEVSIGAVSVLVFLDWRNEVKRGFLISYAFIYLVLVGLTYLLQQNFSNPELLNTFHKLDKAWTASLSLPLLLFFLLLILYSILLLFDPRAGVAEPAKPAPLPQPVAGEQEGALASEAASPEVVGAEAANAEQLAKPVQTQRISLIRPLRLLSGVATVLAGLATLFVIAMIYRPIAADNLGGIFTVAGFFAAAFALGGVLTAMWLGHWYLVTPALSGRPLQFSTTLVLVAIVAQIIFMLAAGPSLPSSSGTPSTPPAVTAPTPTPSTTPSDQVKPVGAPVVAPLSNDAIYWLRILVGFVMTLVLGALSWKLIRDRSFQSATGMLYLVVVCTLAGEIMARGLFLTGIS